MSTSKEAEALNTPFFPATDVLAVAREVLRGKIAAGEGDETEMLKAFELAVQTEDYLP